MNNSTRLLAAQAFRERTSKAALIRRLLAEPPGRGVSTSDPLDALVGSIDEEPGDIDDIVYGR